MAREPKRKQPKRSSTTGKKNPRVDTSNWRKSVRKGRIKFDDDAKEVYLAELAKHGMKGRAAKAAGVTPDTVRGHLENDPDFAEAYNIAEQEYRDKFVDHATTLAYDGIEVKKYNKDGDLIEERRDYPIRLIELELKRIEPGYRDKQTIDLNHAGGVMVAPPDMTPEQWIEEQEKKNASKAPPDEADEE